jgi:hypothetical protein
VLVVPGHNFFVGMDDDWEHKHECLRVSYAQDAGVVQSRGSACCLWILRSRIKGSDSLKVDRISDQGV